MSDAPTPSLDWRDLIAAAERARDVLREVTLSRRKIGPLATKAQAAVHQLNAALTPSKPTLGEGWKLVPEVMTPEMRFAWECMDGNPVDAQWAAVLSASPTPKNTGDDR